MSVPGLPGFLIIGSAKSGTTTLFSDLGANEHIFFPVVKEPSDLVQENILDRRGIAKYRQIFRAAGPDQMLGEASTVYTSRPRFEGVPERALHVLGRQLKLIYVVRDPLERMLSEHRYAAHRGRMSGDLDVALRDEPQIMERSRYAYQLAPWLQRFPQEQLRIVVFEQYIADREATVRSLFDFLGVPTPAGYRLPDAKNGTNDVIVARGVLRHIVHTQLYQRTMRRFVPNALRERAKAVLGRKLDVHVDQRLSPANERALVDRLTSEVVELHRIAGWERPMWKRFA